MDWSTVVPLITAGVSTAGQIAAARQQGRQVQASQQGNVDALNQRGAESTLGVQQRALDAQDAARLARALGMLQEAQAARQAPGQRASNAVRGDILANGRDATFNGGSSRIPSFSFSGGLRPSMFSGNTRQLGQEMSREALLDQLKGAPTPFSNLPEADYSRILNAPAVPGGTALPEGSRMDSILQAIGQYGGLAAGVANAYQGGQPAAGTPSVGAPASGSYFQPGAMPGAVNTPAPPPVEQPYLAGRNPLNNIYTRPTGPGRG
jgi:hypothetical protein